MSCFIYILGIHIYTIQFITLSMLQNFVAGVEIYLNNLHAKHTGDNNTP